MNKISRWAVLMVIMLLNACNSEEPKVIEEVPVEVEYVYDPIVTKMESDSPLDFPASIGVEWHLIRNEEELHYYFPTEIISSHQEYEQIDFSEYNLISLKFRVFYEVYKIEYKLRQNDKKLVVLQHLDVNGAIVPEGFLVMSNILVKKDVDISYIELTQSYSWNH